MIRHVVLRDDDISYFTPVDWLERLYEPLLERGLPFALSVIPSVRADVSDPHADNPYWKHLGYRFAPFIPPAFRGRPESFDVGENRLLVDFLKRNPQIEVVQHGYAHEVLNGFREFEVPLPSEVEYRVCNGKRLLQQAFGAEARFFVPPWDTLSLQATKVLRRHFSGVSLTAYSHRVLPRYLTMKFLFKKWLRRDYLFWGNFLLLEHPGAYLNRFEDPVKTVGSILDHLSRHSHYVLVNHHWEYFLDWTDKPLAEFFSAWQKVLKELLSREDVRIVRFSELYLLLREEGTPGAFAHGLRHIGARNVHREHAALRVSA